MRLRFFILGIKTSSSISWNDRRGRESAPVFHFNSISKVKQACPEHCRRGGNERTTRTVQFCTARSSGGRQRSFNDEMGLKLRLIDGTENTRVTGSRGLGQVGTFPLHSLLGQPGKGDRLQPVCAYPQCVSELNAALGESCIHTAH